MDPELPTQRDPITPVTLAVADIDSNAVHDTDDTVQQSGIQTQNTVPTPASPNNEVVLIKYRGPY